MLKLKYDILIQKEEVSPDKAESAVVVFSGGQDSTTCLCLAQDMHKKVLAVTFDYGQRHQKEIQMAKQICVDLNVEHEVLDAKVLGSLNVSALLDKESDISASHKLNSSLPASFVPGRNALFLTMAHAIAQTQGAGFVYTGTCETDYSGYPDCRQKFISVIESALNIGYEQDIRILTPLMHLDKAQTFALAKELNCLDVVVEQTNTCYNGSDRLMSGGYGCGECPACKLRTKGWKLFVSGGFRKLEEV